MNLFLPLTFSMTLGKAFNLQVPLLQEHCDSQPEMQFENRKSILIFLSFPPFDLIIAMWWAALLTCPTALLGAFAPPPGLTQCTPSWKGAPLMLGHSQLAAPQATCALSSSMD